MELQWDAWLVIGVIISIVGLQLLTRLPTDATFVGGLSVLLISGVLDTETALSGFSAPGMITVGVLYVVVAGLQETGGLSWISHHVLGFPKGARRARMRMLLPVVPLSAFLNNTPVVAMFIPVVSEWCRRLRISPSHMLIPLSYASIFGGVCTLIGTSTNLVVNTMYQARYANDGLSMFEIARVGLPCAVIGALYLIFFSHRLLPQRRTMDEVFDNPREYTLEMEVAPKSMLAGNSIEKSGLRNLPGGFLAELIRDGQIMSAVSPSEILEEGDRLVFVGNIESMQSLYAQQGLHPARDQLFKLDTPRHQRCLVEVVVSHTCPLVGKTIRQGRFRNVYNAVVIAVARNGERLSGKIGDVRLKAGDLLLVESHAGFIPRQKDSRDFYLVSGVENVAPRRFEKAPYAFGMLALMVILVSFGWLTMLQSALLASAGMLLLRCCSPAQARKSIEWNVLIVIGSALGLGAGLEQTGAAAVLAEGLLGAVREQPLMALALVYLITNVFTEMMTNNAAAVLVFPIAMSTADHLAVNPMPFVICVMVAASASFATPIGYQTNLMVYGPGGYRFADYLRIGIPLNLMFGVMVVLLSPLIWPF